jgi:hypothetical protein
MDGAPTGSPWLFHIKAANMLIMYKNKQIRLQLPYLKDQQSLTLTLNMF